MDLQQTTRTYRPSNLDWLHRLWGIEAASTLTVLISAATKATHYPDGIIKPGTLLARYTSGGNSGLWAPFVNDGSLGLNTVGAVVVSGFEIRNDPDGAVIGTRTMGAAVLAGVPLQIHTAKLPGLLLADGTTAYAPTAANLNAAGFIPVTL